MKFKKLLGITLLAIPLYFFTPNTAKAEEFKINLKDKGVTTEETKPVKGNIFNDLDLGNIVQNMEGFIQRTNERIEKRIYEEHFLLDISYETRHFLFNGENATKHMNDMKKNVYMDKVNDDIEKIIKKEFRKEAQEEFRDSRFYKWFKDEVTYYRKRVRRGLSSNVKVYEKEAYITDEGGVNFHFKREEFKNVPESERFNLRFKGSKLSVEHKKYFKFNLKAKPFSFHSWDYTPRLDLDLITKYVSIQGKTSCEFMDEKLKASIATSLPEGLVLSFGYNRDNKDETNSFTTSIAKIVKGYNLGLSYTKARDNKNYSGSGIVMFTFDKTW